MNSNVINGEKNNIDGEQNMLAIYMTMLSKKEKKWDPWNDKSTKDEVFFKIIENTIVRACDEETEINKYKNSNEMGLIGKRPRKFPKKRWQDSVKWNPKQLGITN